MNIKEYIQIVKELKKEIDSEVIICKIIEEWKWKNGAADFDLKNHNIYLFDGGLFNIEKEIKKRPRYRLYPIKEGKFKGGLEFKPIKGKKVKYEDYKAILWFEDLDETINYLKRMKRMLNKIGYRTTPKWIEKWKMK